MAREQWAKDNPTLYKGFHDAMAESLAYTQAHPEAVRAMLPAATPNIRLPVWSSLIDRRQLAQLAKYCKQFGAITTLPNLTKLVPASISTGLLLQGDVGAKTIALKLDGKPATSLLAGDYTFVVSDRSARQNFHLKGPGPRQEDRGAAGGPAELHDEAGEGRLHLLERREPEAEGVVPGHVSPNLRVRGRTAHPEASRLPGQRSTMRAMAVSAHKTGSGQSQSLERGLAILSAFKPATPELGISELARVLGLTRSTSHRYVATLARLGYLQQNPQSRKYRLGPRVLDLGFSAINSMELRQIAADHLQQLSDETGHTVNMAILDGTDIVYIERCRSQQQGQREIDLNLHVGSRLPAYCTSMGKVLLAGLPAEERRAVLDRGAVPAARPEHADRAEGARAGARRRRRGGDRGQQRGARLRACARSRCPCATAPAALPRRSTSPCTARWSRWTIS